MKLKHSSCMTRSHDDGSYTRRNRSKPVKMGYHTINFSISIMESTTDNIIVIV